MGTSQKKQQNKKQQFISKNVMIPLDELKDEEVDVSTSQYEAKRYNIRYDSTKDLQEQVLESLEKICKNSEESLQGVISQIQSHNSQVQTLPRYQHKKQENIRQQETQRMQLTHNFTSSSRLYDEWFERKQQLEFSTLSTDSSSNIMTESHNEEYYERGIQDSVQKLIEKNNRRLELIKQYKQWENKSQIAIKRHDFSNLQQQAEKSLQLAYNTTEQYYNAVTLNLLQGYINQYTLDDKLLDQFEEKYLPNKYQLQMSPRTSQRKQQLSQDGRKKTIEKLINQITQRNDKIKQLIEKYNTEQKPKEVQKIIDEYKQMFIEKKPEDVEKQLPDMSPVEKRVEQQSKFVEELKTRMDKTTTQDIIKLQQFLKTEYTQDQILQQLDEQIKKEEKQKEELKECTFVPEISEAGKQFKNETENFVERFAIQETYRKKKLETLQKKEDDKIMSKCTFKPEIDQKASNIQNKDNIYVRLQKHSQAKVLLQSQLENLRRSGLDSSAITFQDL